MRYIEDKKLFSAVMFAIKVAKQGSYAFTHKAVRKSSDYYNIDESLIYPYIAEAMKDDARGLNRFSLFYNCHDATGLWGYWAIVCPECGHIQVAGDHNWELNAVREAPCPVCGFVDHTFGRKDMQGGAQ